MFNKNFVFSVPKDQSNYYDLQEYAARNRISIEDAIKQCWAAWNTIDRRLKAGDKLAFATEQKDGSFVYDVFDIWFGPSDAK